MNDFFFSWKWCFIPHIYIVMVFLNPQTSNSLILSYKLQRIRRYAFDCVFRFQGVWTCSLVICRYKILQIFATSINKNHRKRKEGAPQNFFSIFIDEPERQLFIKKTVEVENQYSPNNQEKLFFEKMKQAPAEMLSLYMFLPKMVIIWCMVPEIGLKQIDFFVILGHFLLFYTLSLFSPNNQENKKKILLILSFYRFVSVYYKRRLYDAWFLRYKAQQTGNFGASFCPFTPYHPENGNIEKMKKASGHIIILHMCTKNDDHMMYGSLECYKHNFLPIWANFCPFTP